MKRIIAVMGLLMMSLMIHAQNNKIGNIISDFNGKHTLRLVYIENEYRLQFQISEEYYSVAEIDLGHTKDDAMEKLQSFYSTAIEAKTHKDLIYSFDEYVIYGHGKDYVSIEIDDYTMDYIKISSIDKTIKTFLKYDESR